MIQLRSADSISIFSIKKPPRLYAISGGEHAVHQKDAQYTRALLRIRLGCAYASNLDPVSS